MVGTINYLWQAAPIKLKRIIKNLPYWSFKFSFHISNSGVLKIGKIFYQTKNFKLSWNLDQ